MKNFKNIPKGVLSFAIIEIAIGLITICGITYSLLSGLNTKPINILTFVYVTAFLSCALGLGIVNFNKQAYELLLFFVGVVILTKILIFTQIIHLNGALETKIPSDIKNLISILYHIAIIFYFKHKNINILFNK